MRALFLCLVLCGALSAQQTYTLTEATTVQATPLRPGINFAQTSVSGVGQPWKDLFYPANGQMEGYVTSQLWACGAGTTTSCSMYNIHQGDLYDSQIPLNFFAGGTFTVLVANTNGGGAGAARGCTGSITGNYQGAQSVHNTLTATYNNGTGVATYTNSSALPASWANGDYVAIDGGQGGGFSQNGYGNNNNPVIGALLNVTGTTFQLQLATGLGLTSDSNGNGGRLIKFSFGTTCGAAIQNGDVIGITTSGAPAACSSSCVNHFNSGDYQGSSGGVGSLESTDLPPGSTGHYALKIDNSANSSSQSNVEVSVDTGGGGDSPGVLMNGGTWRVQFQIKTTSCTGTCTVNASIARYGGTGFTTNFAGNPYTITPNGTAGAGWQTITQDFTPAETAASAAGGKIRFLLSTSATQGVYLLKNVKVFQLTGTNGANTTVYRDAIVTALTNFKPGTLRLWDGNTGETLDNWISNPDGHAIARFNEYPGSADGKIQSLPEFLELCVFHGADPFISVPTWFDNTSASNLIDYLAGSGATTYGAKRNAWLAANGYAQTTFTSLFNKIHLELGDESWNSAGGFTGQNLIYQIQMGQLDKYTFGAMKANSNYTSGKFDMVLNCRQGDNSTFGPCYANHQADTTGHDSITQSGYTYLVDGMTTTNSTTEWTAKVATTWGYINDATNGNGAVMTALIAGSGRVVPINIYEEQDSQQGFGGTTTVNNAQMSNDVSAQGSGLAQVIGYMEIMKAWNAPQNIWNFMQYVDQACCSLGNIPIWGIGIGYGGGNNQQRPVQVMQGAANQCIIGTEYGGAWTSRNTFNSAALNGYNALNGVPYAHMWAFKSGTSRCIVAVNADPTNAQVVTWGGNVPSGSMTQTLISAAENATNEVAGTISIAPAVSTVTAASTYSIPAHSMVTLAFTSGAPTPSIASVTPNTGAQGTTISSVAIVGTSTNFVNGTSVGSFSGTGITVNTTTVSDATHATLNITIAGGATLGARDVTVTTGAEVATMTSGFTVSAAAVPSHQSTMYGNAHPSGNISVH
jgi:hypothetical protein